MLDTGELARLIEEDAVVGVTSNPTIFEKALSSGAWYDEQFRDELAGGGDPKDVFIALAVEDVQRACDLLHPVWERTGGVDGFVSLGVVASAVGVWLGFEIADPLVGLGITLVILKITWDSWRVVTRTEPGELVEHAHARQ